MPFPILLQRVEKGKVKEERKGGKEGGREGGRGGGDEGKRGGYPAHVV